MASALKSIEVWARHARLLSFKLLRLMVDGPEAVGIVHENVQCLANNNVSEAFAYVVDHRSREVAVSMKRREFLKKSVFLHTGYGCGIPIVRTSASFRKRTYESASSTIMCGVTAPRSGGMIIGVSSWNINAIDHGNR